MAFISYDGTDDWKLLRFANVAIAGAAAVGRFSSYNASDVLLWHDNYLDISTRGRLEHHSARAVKTCDE